MPACGGGKSDDLSSIGGSRCIFANYVMSEEVMRSLVEPEGKDMGKGKYVMVNVLNGSGIIGRPIKVFLMLH